MKKILILYPHFPPSNLAGVHRPRLFANHLKEFGWEPTILTVHEDYYEEKPDWNLVKLLPEDLRIEKVTAFATSKPRFIGDIGLRGFFQLYKKAKTLITNERYDMLYIPIPSFYCALLGRWLHSSTGVRYGIDYIDPWVHPFPGADKLFSRHWISSKIANWLEPLAVKKASLITGVAPGYYEGMLQRNPLLRKNAVTGAMPYGGEERDHTVLRSLELKPYLFQKKPGKLQMIYAGALLPKALGILEAVFKAIKKNSDDFIDIEFHFIGTGRLPNDPGSYSIKSLAVKYGLWETGVFEYPQRIAYLDVLAHLDAADGIFILGSTEKHYTPSKIYQGVLSGKPIFALLHEESTAIKIIRTSGAGIVLDFYDKNWPEKIENDFRDCFTRYKNFLSNFEFNPVDKTVFEDFSAKNITRRLASLLDDATRYH